MIRVDRFERRERDLPKAKLVLASTMVPTKLSPFPRDPVYALGWNPTEHRDWSQSGEAHTPLERVAQHEQVSSANQSGCKTTRGNNPTNSSRFCNGSVGILTAVSNATRRTKACPWLS